MREYSVSGKGITITNAACTLVFINPAATRVIEVTGAWCSQFGTTTSAQIGIEIGTKVTAFPTLTSATPSKTKTSDAVSSITGGTAGAAGTSGINASAEGAGAITTIWPDSFNNLTPWIWNPMTTLGQTLIISGADAAGVYLKLQAAPSSLANWNFGITFREIG